MTEDELLNKYEYDFAKYCYDADLATHEDAYLLLMDSGAFWDWLEEYHYDEWKALEEESKWNLIK